jgi:short-subunit dehydrogenase
MGRERSEGVNAAGMIRWVRRLDARWMRRYSGPPRNLPGDAGRKPVTVITGGSEGIGRALANAFAKDGHAILLVASGRDGLERAVAELRRDFGVDVYAAAIDLSAPDAVAQLDAALDANGVYADYLVNNAGIGLGGAFAEQDAEKLERLVRLNVGALTALTRRYLPDMVARSHGGLLNLASLGGLLPGPYQAAYYASKAYVVSLTEALAYENAGQGVRISAALPGPVATRFHERMGVTSANYMKFQTVPNPEAVARDIYSGFMGRRTLIAPGVLPTLNFMALRLIPIPNFILVPFIGWFLKQRY